jgi:regulatory protein
MSFEYGEKAKKKLTVRQALLRAQKSCAYQERCQQEMRDKLYDWGLHSEEVESVIADLISENFLNEERYSIAFAGGKFRIKSWGKNKIRAELKRRRISDYCIKKALSSIDEDAYQGTLQRLAEKKMREADKGRMDIRKHKVTQYLMSRGFESDLIRDVLKEIS